MKKLLIFLALCSPLFAVSQSFTFDRITFRDQVQVAHECRYLDGYDQVKYGGKGFIIHDRENQILRGTYQDETMREPQETFRFKYTNVTSSMDGDVFEYRDDKGVLNDRVSINPNDHTVHIELGFENCDQTPFVSYMAGDFIEMEPER